MRLAQLLRLTALGIALMCLLDPPVVVSPAAPIEVDAAIVRSPRDSRPATDRSSMTIAEAAESTTARLREALGRAGTLRVSTVQPGDRLPCDASSPCVVITEGAAVDQAADRSAATSVILLGEDLSPNLEVRHVDAPPAHAAGQASARVTVAGRGVQGREVQVRLYDGDVLVGEGMERWSADGEATIDVPWWPIAPGRRTLIARVSTSEEERTATDNTLTVSTEVLTDPWPVLVLERRASWAGTFLRRALERDARFAVSALTDLAPSVSVASLAARGLDAARLDAHRVVVVGAPEALSEADVSRLERYVSDRGGALVLLPDRAMSGPVSRLLAHRWRERLDREPTPAGPLHASEWLVLQDTGPLDEVWAESEAGPVVVASPLGRGVVVVSGALDAWRRRSDGGFDAYWSATIARLALGVSEPVSLTIDQDTGAPGAEVAIELEARTSASVDRWRAYATRICEDAAPISIRLWPGDGPGAFSGRVPMGKRTGCRLEAAVDGVGKADVRLPDREAGRETFRWTALQAEAFAARHGGQLVRDAGVDSLVQSWLAARSTERRPEPRYPMRSWWWFLPFVTALAAEWWLRRRAGLR